MLSSRTAGLAIRHLSPRRLLPINRYLSTASAPLTGGGHDPEELQRSPPSRDDVSSSDQKQMTSYWGVAPTKLAKEDGTEWRWTCFKPWDTYKADVSIDLKKHHAPTTFPDKLAFWMVKSLRIPTDVFFQKNDGLANRRLNSGPLTDSSRQSRLIVRVLPGFLLPRMLHMNFILALSGYGSFLEF